MPLVGAPAVCLHSSVFSVGPAFFCVAFFHVFPGLLSSVYVCVCVCTLGTPREILEFQFCECDSVNEIR